MRRLILAILLALSVLAGSVGSALADQPNGQLGNGTLGYDGYPGNQSNNK